MLYALAWGVHVAAGAHDIVGVAVHVAVAVGAHEIVPAVRAVEPLREAAGHHREHRTCVCALCI